MTYEEEQVAYAQELKQVIKALKALDELFAQPENVDDKIRELYERISPLDFKYNSLSGYEIQYKINVFRQDLEEEYKSKKTRKKELEYLLSQTPAERTKENIKNKIISGAEYMAGITPQHVNGKIYKVENKDGCGTFALWFCIIDIVIVFLYYLISESF